MAPASFTQPCFAANSTIFAETGGPVRVGRQAGGGVQPIRRDPDMLTFEPPHRAEHDGQHRPGQPVLDHQLEAPEA
jgi:hypothetical protein